MGSQARRELQPGNRDDLGIGLNSLLTWPFWNSDRDSPACVRALYEDASVRSKVERDGADELAKQWAALADAEGVQTAVNEQKAFQSVAVANANAGSDIDEVHAESVSAALRFSGYEPCA